MTFVSHFLEHKKYSFRTKRLKSKARRDKKNMKTKNFKDQLNFHENLKGQNELFTRGKG
jgi:hypothetical protein